ncbi:MAG: large-conductance mechanosensitive channel protein MscL [Chthoniobacterales bacterium]
MASLLEEFKTFAVKGNAVDMAVGIILGAAFTKVVNSIVSDLLMPPIGLLIGGTNFENLKLVLKEAQGETAAVAIQYGAFINNVIEFLIVAWSVFIVVKIMNRLIAERDSEEKKAE